MMILKMKLLPQPFYLLVNQQKNENVPSATSTSFATVTDENDADSEDEDSDSSTTSTDSSYLTMRTSCSVLHDLSSPSSAAEGSETETTTCGETFDNVLDKLRTVRDMPNGSESTPNACNIPTTGINKNFDFEVWRQVLPNEVVSEDSAAKEPPPRAKKSTNETTYDK